MSIWGQEYFKLAFLMQFKRKNFLNAHAEWPSGHATRHSCTVCYTKSKVPKCGVLSSGAVAMWLREKEQGTIGDPGWSIEHFPLATNRIIARAQLRNA